MTQFLKFLTLLVLCQISAPVPVPRDMSPICKLYSQEVGSCEADATCSDHWTVSVGSHEFDVEFCSTIDMEEFLVSAILGNTF